MKFKDNTNLKELANEIGEYFQEKTEGLQSRIQNNLTSIHERLVKKYPEKVEIRVMKHRPALGYFIIDANEDYGYMRVEPYICQTELHERPMFQLSKNAETYWFDIYKKDYENYCSARIA